MITQSNPTCLNYEIPAWAGGKSAFLSDKRATSTVVSTIVLTSVPTTNGLRKKAISGVVKSRKMRHVVR